MYRWSVQPVIWRALLQAFLNAVVTRPAALLIATPKIELYTNIITLTGANAWGDFTKATFAGYAQAAVTWADVGNLLGGDQVLGTQVNFAADTPIVTPETIRGYIVSDGAANVYMAENFAVPVPFATGGDYLDINVKMVVKASPQFASS